MALARAGETPRQCMAIALGFSSIKPAVCFALELRVQCIELGADRGRKLLELATAIRMQPFGAMEAPDFGRGLDSQQRQNF